MTISSTRRRRGHVLAGFLCLALISPGFAIADQGGVEALPGDAPMLGLDACIEEALTGNAGLASERERRRELDGQMIQARATGLPSLDVSGTWSRNRDPSFALNESFSEFISPEDLEAQTYWNTSLGARWELNPGRIYNAIGAAKLGIERQEAVLLDQEQRLVEAVCQSYYMVVGQAEALAALDADLAAKEEFLSITRKRLDLGMSTPLDTLRAAVALANLRPQRRAAAQRLADAGAALNTLMGRETLSPLRVAALAEPENAVVDEDDALAALTRRPDLKQAELLEAILRKNRGAQKSEQRPYLSANASYGFVGRDVETLFDEGHDTWSSSLTLNIPIFNGFLTRGQVKETEAAIRRSGHAREEALRQARRELLTLLGDLEAARENLAAGRLNEAAAEEALAQVQRRYELGQGDYLGVLDAQAQRRQARELSIGARSQVLSLIVSLKRMLGSDPRRPLAEILAELAHDEHAGGTR